MRLPRFAPRPTALRLALSALLTAGVVGGAVLVVGASPAQQTRGGGEAQLTASRSSAPSSPAAATAAPTTPQRSAAAPTLPLAGRTIVVDPGHQLGNARHKSEINKLVDARGLRKPCNSTGTSTNGGYPEATFAWRVAVKARKELTALGATVLMTRQTNSYSDWGPCVDVRGRWGNAGSNGLTKPADLLVSIHGDGSSARNRGFHVIVSTANATRSASTAYAEATRAALEAAAFPRSTYIGKGTALSFRSDLATINWADEPAIMVELGNMRNRSDAALMTSRAGRTAYAHALVSGAQSYLAAH